MNNTYKYQDGLETERLITRFLREEDYLLFVDYMADEECRRYLPYYNIDDPQDMARHLVNKQIDRYKNQRYGLQLLIDKNTNDPIGLCGLLLQDVDDGRMLEVGYHVLKQYWGKGYASEAALMFKNYGFENKQNDCIVSMIMVGNEKSQRVATKNGMKPDPDREWLGYHVNIYRIYKNEWENSL